MFQNDEFKLFTSDGEEFLHQGYYLICDGGFMRWRCLMTGYKYYSSLKEALWSAQMESTRKDVERAFGILKGRFRCLKLPILFQQMDRITYMMWTCVIIHNMILSHDGRDNLWESDDWDGVDGEHDMNDDEWSMNKMKIIKIRALNKLTDYSRIGRRHYIAREDLQDNEDEGSGVQNFEPALEKLRRKLFDDEFNSVMLIKKRLEKATTTTTSEMSLDDASSAAADDEINNTSNYVVAPTTATNNNSSSSTNNNNK